MRYQESQEKDFSENPTRIGCSDLDFQYVQGWKDRENGTYEEDLRIITIGSSYEVIAESSLR